MICQMCHAPASFVYITIDTRRKIPMCAMCAGKYISRAVDQCRAHDPRITVPATARSQLN